MVWGYFVPAMGYFEVEWPVIFGLVGTRELEA